MVNPRLSHSDLGALSLKRRTSRELIYLCPFCDDRRGHLYVNILKGTWFCFKEGRGGYLDSSNLNSLSSQAYYKEQIVTPPPTSSHKLPPDFTPLSMNSFDPFEQLLINYLQKRYLKKEQWGLFSPGYSLIQEYWGRVIICYQNFFIARAVISSCHPPYINPPAIVKPLWFYTWSKEGSLLLVEGVFDLIKVLPLLDHKKYCGAGALLGKSISIHQRQSLQKVSKDLTLLLDKDAYLDALSLAINLSAQGFNCNVLKLSHSKDPNSCSSSKLKELL